MATPTLNRLPLTVRQLVGFVSIATSLNFACNESSNSKDTATGGAGGNAPTDGTGGASTSNANNVWGNVKVSLIAEEGGVVAHTSVLGTLYDSPEIPETYITAATSGDCSLLTPTAPPFCDPGCSEPTPVCTIDGKCVKNPTLINVGELSMGGLSVAGVTSTFALKSVANKYQPPGTVKLDYPPCATGDTAKVSGTFSGSNVEAATACIEPLDLLNSDPVPLESGSPLTLEWTAPSSGTNSKIFVELDISHHGGSKGRIRCLTKDIGQLTIDETLVTALIELGVTGFPQLTVTRTSTGTSAIGEGSLNLTIENSVGRLLQVPGIYNCTESSECPAEKPTCNPDFMMCE
jgi:hypothetical protein